LNYWEEHDISHAHALYSAIFLIFNKEANFLTMFVLDDSNILKKNIWKINVEIFYGQVWTKEQTTIYKTLHIKLKIE
jgi:hypothetical protein